MFSSMVFRTVHELIHAHLDNLPPSLLPIVLFVSVLWRRSAHGLPAYMLVFCRMLCFRSLTAPSIPVRDLILVETFLESDQSQLLHLFAFLVNFLSVSNIKFHALYCNYFYPFLKSPNCVLFSFTISVRNCVWLMKGA